MEGTSPQIKALIRYVYDFHRRRSEQNLAQLQRQIQILSVVNDLSIFEPKCMGTVELYICLEGLLKASDSRSVLAWKVINLLSNICRSASIKHALRDQLLFLPVLTDYLVNSNLTDDKSEKTLQLIQDICYGIKLDRIEAWLLEIIPYLMGELCNGINKSTETAINTLANLSRGNNIVQEMLRESSYRKSVMSTMNKLESPTIRMKLLISEVIIYMNNDPKLMGKMAYEALSIIFSSVTDGMTNDDYVLIELAIDILGNFSSRADLQVAIHDYPKLAEQCQTILSYIAPESDPRIVGGTFSLFSTLIQTKHRDMGSIIDGLCSSITSWIENAVCYGAAKAAHMSVSQFGDTIDKSHLDGFVEAIKISITKCCTSPEEEKSFESESQLTWLHYILCLIEDLCTVDIAVCVKLSMALLPKSFSTILEMLLESNTFLGESSVSCLNGTDINGSFQHRRGSMNLVKIPKRKLQSSECILRLLTCAKLLSAHKAEFIMEHNQMMSNPKVMQSIVICERSACPDLIERAIKLTCGSTLPQDSLNSLVSFHINASVTHNDISQVFDDEPMQCSGSQSSQLSNRFSSTMFSSEMEERVDQIISRLNGAVDNISKSELTDIPLTDIMDFYECKMGRMTHSELKLKDALKASESHNRHIQLSLMQSKTECESLRILLRKWQCRVETCQNEIKQNNVTAEAIREDAKKMRTIFTKEKTAVERQLVEAENENNSIQTKLESKDAEVRLLQKQLSEAISEQKSLQKQIKQEQERNKDWNSKHTSLEEKLKNQKKSLESAEKDTQRLEKDKTNLKMKNSELELLIHSQEEAMSEKDIQLDDMTKKYKSLKRLQDMIHDISGKPM